MLLSSADNSIQGTKNANRIRHSEVSVSLCLDCGTPIAARLVELTRQDLMIISDRPLRYGTSVQLALFGDLATTVTQNRGLVHWYRPTQHGWQIGIFLTMPLPDRLTEREWSDLWACLRYECNWKAWVLWDGDGQLEPVWLTDYSINGLSLAGKRNVPAGCKFTLFGSSKSHDRSALNGDVQWTRKNPDGVLIGCHVHRQRGRDLPKMFGNLDALHVAPEENKPLDQRSDSLETLNCELAACERFLPAGEGLRNNSFHEFSMHVR